MRVSALPVAVVTVTAVVALACGCATTVEGHGTIAEGVSTGSPTPSSEPSSDPSGSSSPETTSPAATPTTDPILVRERLLCVLGRASIVSINNQFNKSKDRDVQIKVLRTGATTISGHLSRSGLPADDRIRKPGQGVLDQLTKLVREAGGGGSPSTTPYNQATQRFQQACDGL